MNWTFDTRGLPGFIRIGLVGDFTEQDFAAMLDDLTQKDYFDPGARLMFDDTNLKLGEMSDRQLMSASNTFISQNKALTFAKVAILTTAETFDVGQKFEQITKFSSRAILEIFDDERKALEWLVGPAAAILRGDA